MAFNCYFMGFLILSVVLCEIAFAVDESSLTRSGNHVPRGKTCRIGETPCEPGYFCCASKKSMQLSARETPALAVSTTTNAQKAIFAAPLPVMDFVERLAKCFVE
ncbi:unnamed protein product, partial [Mesorhabditis spiculigera]